MSERTTMTGKPVSDQAPARVELFNTYNACLGRFCNRHGKERLKKLKQEEKEQVK